MAALVPTVIAVAFLAITACYVIGAAWIRNERARAPAKPPPGMADLDPYELALLSGGRWRLGEVALADARLEGSVRIERRAGFLRRARIRFVPGALDRSSDRHPVLVSALSRALDGAQESVTMPPEHLVMAGSVSEWAPKALVGLRTCGLVLPAERIGWAQSLRRAASRLHRGVVLPMVVLAAIATAVTFPMLLGRLPGAPPLSVPGFFLGTLGPPALLYAVHQRFGPVVVVAVMAAGALAFLPVTSAALGAVALCGVWLAVYGVFAATRRASGSRTPAGDAVLADARTRLSEEDGSDRERVLRAVALYGISGLRKPEQVAISFSVTATVDPSFPAMADFAEQCGDLGGPSSDLSGGGTGGTFDADGSPSGFDAGVAGGGHGGFDGGSGGGDGGGGGGGPGGGGGGGDG